MDYGNAGGVLTQAPAMWGGVPAATWISAGSQVLGAAMQQAPTSATSGAYQSSPVSLDFGNWTVATGGSKAQGGTTGLDLGALLSSSPYIILGLAAMGLIAWKHKKSA